MSLCGKAWGKKMGFSQALAIGSVLTGVTLFATNPTQDEYASWLKQQAFKRIGGGFEGALVSLLGGPIINLNTTREDFLFFSTYETDIGGGTKIKSIGVLRNFIPIPSPAPEYPHVVSAGTKGRWLPEDGYTWINDPPVPGDFRVKWTSGRLSSQHPHVVAADAEGRWLPEGGYTWINDPPVPGDFRVRPVADSASTALAVPRECSNAFKRQWQGDFNNRKMAAVPCILSTDTGAYYCDNSGCSRCGPAVPLSKCGIEERPH
jgi:hypothetical protein